MGRVELSSYGTAVPIAAAESSGRVRDAEDFIINGGLDVVQIDAGRVGGITPAHAVRRLVEARGATYVNHTFKSHLSLAAALHVFATVQRFELLEYAVGGAPLGRDARERSARASRRRHGGGPGPPRARGHRRRRDGASLPAAGPHHRRRPRARGGGSSHLSHDAEVAMNDLAHRRCLAPEIREPAAVAKCRHADRARGHRGRREKEREADAVDAKLVRRPPIVCADGRSGRVQV